MGEYEDQKEKAGEYGVILGERWEIYIRMGCSAGSGSAGCLCDGAKYTDCLEDALGRGRLQPLYTYSRDIHGRDSRAQSSHPTELG